MNCSLIKNITIEDVKREVAIIENNISIMDVFIKDITTKLNQITNFSSSFTQKNNLFSNEENIQLKLQTALLNNEKEHITHLKKIFITNLFNELYDLSNNIILLISSFSNLEFKDTTNKAEILKKLVRIKQLTVIKITDINESVIAISKNMNLIYDTLEEFNDYIEEMGSNIKAHNYHCFNIYTTLKHKYNFIMLEYTKYYSTLNNILPYYKSLSAKIKKQMDNKYILFYCLTNEIDLDTDSTDTEEIILNNTQPLERHSPRLMSIDESTTLTKNVADMNLNNTATKSSLSSMTSLVSIDATEKKNKKKGKKVKIADNVSVNSLTAADDVFSDSSSSSKSSLTETKKKKTGNSKLNFRSVVNKVLTNTHNDDKPELNSIQSILKKQSTLKKIGSE